MDFWEIACIFAHSKRERMKYTLLAKDRKSEARRGMLTTDHGTVETPIFMPVGRWVR